MKKLLFIALMMVGISASAQVSPWDDLMNQIMGETRGKVLTELGSIMDANGMKMESEDASTKLLFMFYYGDDNDNNDYNDKVNQIGVWMTDKSGAQNLSANFIGLLRKAENSRDFKVVEKNLTGSYKYFEFVKRDNSLAFMVATRAMPDGPQLIIRTYDLSSGDYNYKKLK